MLKNEGIFDQINKKPIPEFPGHIGVVTSAAGAAVHDIINVATRRFEGIFITVYPAKVQGEGAARQIAAGIDYFNEKNEVDVIIVGRGGGSFEDLFAFNEEIVARSVFASKIPVVSAVGHETDYSLCDMAADLRAPTPSAAAELVVKDKRAVLQYIENYEKYIFDQLQKSLYDTERKLSLLHSNVKTYPFELIIEQAEQKVTSLADFLGYNISLNLERRQMSLSKLDDSLEDLNPKKVLQRGYAIVYDENKKVITSSKGKEKNLDIELKDGHIIVERKV
jgi:exodeoxyribonuclease VII large subunit